MKLENPKTVRELSEILGAECKGNEDLLVTGINEIHKVESGDLVFVDHPKYYKKALNSAADIILIDQEVDFPEGKAIIISKKPFDDFNQLSALFRPHQNWENQIGDNFKKGKNTEIRPNVTIGHQVTIGDNCLIHAGVVLNDFTTIEDNVIIGPNSVIGHDAFYYKKKSKGYDRLLSSGETWIRDNVEIGALCTIDRGVSGKTIIGAGTKIDNQVHIGHDTVVGKNCLFAANVGIAGCVVVEDDVTLWGQVGVTSDVIIGQGAVVQAQSGVAKSLEGGKTYFGSPASEAREAMRQLGAIKRLPSLINKL